MDNKITLKIISNSDYQFLYDLLLDRDPKANISHRKMPTFSEHLKFIKSKPYTKWYIILKEEKKIGSIYLSKNDEIGIFLDKSIQGKGFGQLALKQIMEKNPRKRYLANVNPKNEKSKKFFIQNKFKLIQHTYELMNSE